MIRINVEIDASQVQHATEVFLRQTQNLMPVWARVAAVVYNDLRDRFASEGGNTGQAWAPLSPVYRSWKMKHYPSQSIGQLTGDLYRSVISQHGPNSIYDPQPDSLTLGSSVPYAIFFDRGTRRMKSRPVYVLSDRAKADVQTVLYDYLCGRATNSGFKTIKE